MLCISITPMLEDSYNIYVLLREGKILTALRVLESGEKRYIRRQPLLIFTFIQLFFNIW